MRIGLFSLGADGSDRAANNSSNPKEKLFFSAFFATQLWCGYIGAQLDEEEKKVEVQRQKEAAHRQ
jgi:hypothetical protein